LLNLDQSPVYLFAIEHLQQFPNNFFLIIGIGRCSNTETIIGGVAFAVSQYNNILEEHEPFLYLRGDEVKYCDISIIIGKRKMY